MAASDGLLIVDKPSGWTSHDVVGRCRRLAGTRKVGHSGTLDPMATGVLVVGIGRATRLLGHLSLSTKEYDATIRLGQSTVTDDAEGDVLETMDASGLTVGQIRAVLAEFRGDIDQVPSSVSAIKAGGERAYRRVRAGEQVDLPARRIRIACLADRGVRRHGSFVDVDVRVSCSSGTYVRALARDIGARLGVGGHLTALRRTRVGSYGVDSAHTLEELDRHAADGLPIIGLDEAARSAFAWYVVDASQVDAVRNGRALDVDLLPSSGHPELAGPVLEGTMDERRGAAGGPVAVLAPGGQFLALYEQRGPVAKAVAVFAPA